MVEQSFKDSVKAKNLLRNLLVVSSRKDRHQSNTHENVWYSLTMRNLHESRGTNQVKGEKTPTEEVICKVKTSDLCRISRN